MIGFLLYFRFLRLFILYSFFSLNHFFRLKGTLRNHSWQFYLRFDIRLLIRLHDGSVLKVWLLLINAKVLFYNWIFHRTTSIIGKLDKLFRNLLIFAHIQMQVCHIFILSWLIGLHLSHLFSPIFFRNLTLIRFLRKYLLIVSSSIIFGTLRNFQRIFPLNINLILERRSLFDYKYIFVNFDWFFDRFYFLSFLDISTWGSLAL